MRLLSARLIVSLIVGITLVSLGFSYYEVVVQKRALRSDLERRAEVLSESLAGNVEKSWETGSERGLQRLVQRFGCLGLRSMTGKVRQSQSRPS
jgi:hypothetical protein